LLHPRPLQKQKAYHWRSFTPACNHTIWPLLSGGLLLRRSQAPTRKNDLPKGSVEHIKEDGVHRVIHRGPPEERRHEYERDRELANILNIDAIPRQ
jgi:hypothetical protein